MTIDAEFARCCGAESTADRWAEVATDLESTRSAVRVAYANMREAESLVMSREVGQRPVAAVRRAYEAARLLGAEPLVAEVENLARWGRIDLVPTAVVEAGGSSSAQDEFGLTQREQEVLSGLLAGQTNREIAESLFISTKTSSVHVSNILRKLGVKSREEAARVAHRQMFGELSQWPAGPQSPWPCPQQLQWTRGFHIANVPAGLCFQIQACSE